MHEICECVINDHCVKVSCNVERSVGSILGEKNIKKSVNRIHNIKGLKYTQSKM